MNEEKYWGLFKNVQVYKEGMGNRSEVYVNQGTLLLMKPKLLEKITVIGDMTSVFQYDS